MPKVTNASQTFNYSTIHEALSDVIYNLTPTATPLMTLAGKVEASNITWSWSNDIVPAVNASNAQTEGYTLLNSATGSPTRITNVCQLSQRDATVTKTAQSSAVAGVGKGKLMNYKMALAMKALKKDMDTIASGPQARVDEDGSGTRKTRGFEHFLTTSVSSGTGYVAPTSATSALTDGTSLRPLTQSLVRNVLISAYTNNGEPNKILVSPYNKVKFSSFAGRAGLQVPTDENKIVTAFSIYESDFGTMQVLPSRNIRGRTALFVDPELVKFAYFRSFDTYDTAVVGSANTKNIEVEWGLQVDHEAGHAKVADLSYDNTTDIAAGGSGI